MLAAGAYETFDLLRSENVAATMLPPVLIGIFVAAVVGFFAIRWLLNYLARRPLYIFAIYCTVVMLGIAVLMVI